MIFWHRLHYLGPGGEDGICKMRIGPSTELSALNILTHTAFRKTFVLRHDSCPLFDVLGYLLALALHDHIFAHNVGGRQKYVQDRNLTAHGEH